MKRFTSKIPRINVDLFDSFSPCITNEENKELIKVVTDKEIYSACNTPKYTLAVFGYV